MQQSLSIFLQKLLTTRMKLNLIFGEDILTWIYFNLKTKLKPKRGYLR